MRHIWGLIQSPRSSGRVWMLGNRLPSSSPHAHRHDWGSQLGVQQYPESLLTTLIRQCSPTNCSTPLSGCSSAHLQSITPKIQGTISWESKPLSRKIFKIRMFKIISLKNAWGFNTLPNCCKNFDTSIKMLISATKKNPGPYQLCFHENITQNW